MRKVQDGNESPFLSFSLLEQSLLAVESLKSRCKWRKEKRQVVKREVIWEWRSGESWPLVKGKMVCYFAGAWVWTCLFSAPPAKGKPFNKAGALVFSFFFFHFGGLCGNTEWGIGSFSRLTWTCKYNKKQWRIALFACKFKPSTWEGGLIFSIFFFFREQPCESSFWLVCVAVGTSLDRGACFFFFFDLQCPPFLLSYTFILDFGVKTDRIMLDTWIKQQKGGKNYSTQYSRLVSYGSTDWASTCLPTQIGRDGGLSGVYGRSW